MSASDALHRKQFTPAEVKAHVPGAFDLEDAHPDDRFEKRLIPIYSIYSGGHEVASPEMHPAKVHDHDAAAHYRKVAEYQEAMKNGGAAKFPPVVVSDEGGGDHEFLDGHHRLTAAANLGISHTVAYVRTNRSHWG